MDFEIYQIRGSSTVYKLFFLFVCLFKKKKNRTQRLVSFLLYLTGLFPKVSSGLQLSQNSSTEFLPTHKTTLHLTGKKSAFETGASSRWESEADSIGAEF